MNKNLKTAIQAALEAGKAIMEIYQKDFQINYKTDDSPLTEADQKANDIIMDFLRPTALPIISEENKAIDYEERKKWNQCWIVDPLDGTKEFIKKNGEFTVNIALIDNNLPVLGVIYVPAKEELYFADIDAGFSKKVTYDFSQDIENNLANAKAIQPTKSNDSVRIVGSRSHMNDATKDFIDNLDTSKNIEVVSKGSSLKFCLVAEGKADIYPRFAPTMEWDTAAGQAICKAVGLSVIDKSTQKEMLYNRENLLNEHFLVSNQ
ncbi:MAG: 3'(2'),5'-bisphosphate nucleotidase CysQ [Bacteroidota bacterium]